MALFSRLLPTITSAYALQTVLALIFVPQANEKYYDLGGALGFLSTTFTSLYFPSIRAKYWEGKNIPLPALTSFAPRQLLLSAALGIWSIRLGSYLAERAIRSGGDSRFDEIKHQPGKFTFFWMAQATWITLVGLPVYLANAVPSGVHPALAFRDFAALGLFAGSFIFEVTADRQKAAWRAARDTKQHDEKFITSGLWSISRHPNYIGEVGIWTGIWALSTSCLQTAYFPRGTVALAALSPLFTWFLLRKVSGVPPLEKAGDKKFGADPKWKEYKSKVPVFFPWGGYD
jgi:steroid 5-alpha reductase family enzyme